MNARGFPNRSTAGLTKVFVLLLLFLVISLMFSHADATQDDSEILPARIRALEGGATVQRAQEQDRVGATTNLPVLPGDTLWTDEGRVEVQLPDGSLLWIAEGTQVDFLDLGEVRREGEGNTVLRLRSGTLEIEVRNQDTESEEETRIDTPEASVYFLGQGRFRLDTEGSTTLTSFRGVAEMAGDDGSVLVRSGQRSRVESGSAPEEPWAVNTLRLDDFDEWCDQREQSYVSDSDYDVHQGYIEAVPQPVRPYVSELAFYGNWQHLGVYGWVWRPTVNQVGWRPYYNGYWVSCPRGWTWVSYEPWGWGPYHFGRWQWVTTAGWVWIPGGVYSGAWVSWAVTPSYIGWCPLDYYNRPVLFNMGVNVTSVTVNRYDGRVWSFLPVQRFSDRNATRVIVKPERIPNLQGVTTVTRLPRFSPEEVRTHPGIAEQIYRRARLEAAQGASPRTMAAPELVPFQQADRREMASQRGRSRGSGESVNRPGWRTPSTYSRKVVDQSRPELVPPRRSPGPTPGQNARPYVPRESPRRARTGELPNRFGGAAGGAEESSRTGPGPAEGVRQGGGGAPHRPRRYEPPSEKPSHPAPGSDDPSQRVLRRIFPEGSRRETRPPDHVKPSAGGSQPRPPTARMESPRPQPQPSRENPRSRKQENRKGEEKKDKP